MYYIYYVANILSIESSSAVFPRNIGLWDSASFCFCSPLPDTS